MAADTVLDMAAGVPAYLGMRLEVARLQMEGRFVAAEKARTAGMLGIVAGSTPAQLLMAAAGSDNRFVKTYMSWNPQMQAMAGLLKKGEALGRGLDNAQFERGADA